MSDKLNLQLPETRSKPAVKSSKLISALLFCLLILGAANLAVTLRGSKGQKTLNVAGALSSETCKKLALKLEKQGLDEQAAVTWKEYLDQADIEDEERAKIWYRMGKLFQDAGIYTQALSAYYRSESFAMLSELELELGRRVQECLEASGKFAALRYELADRVGMDKNKNKNASGEEVLAEIGNYKITKAEMDRRIEKQIERQMGSLGAFMSEEQIRKQKETALKRFSGTQERLRLLNQLVLEEILYRKAREDKLADVKAVRDILREAQRGILAQQVMERELASKIKMTSSDLKTYYEAYKERYTEGEQAKISHILVKSEEEAKTILNSLENGLDFKILAEKLSFDEATKNKGGEIDSWISRGDYIPGIGHSKDAARIIFNTEIGKIAKQTIKSDKGIHVIKVREKKEKRQKTFDEVKSEVYRDLRKQKETEVQEILLGQLKERYNVVMHMSQFQVQTSPADDSKANNKKHTGKHP